MANDGTVKIGVEVDEKEFASSISKLSKTAKSSFSNITVGVEVDKKGFDSELSKIGKEAKQTKPIEIPVEVDADKFKKELDDLEGETQKNVSSLKELNRALELNPDSTDLLIEKQKLLESAVSAAAQKADMLNSALKNAKASGEAEKNAEAYRQLVIALSRAESEAKNMQAELDDVSAKLEKGQDATEDLEEATDDLGRSYTSVSDIIKGVAIGDLISSGVQAAISGIKDLVGELWNLDDATKEFREGQGKLNAAFEAAHLGPEAAKRAYSDFYKILGDTDTAVEASQLLATLTNSEEDLSTWTNIAAGVFGTFGDALPIEGLIESANETAKTGKVVGVLADALNWAGINEDYFNEELKWAGSESIRNQRIMKTLSIAYAEAALAFNRNNKEIIAARENQIQLDEAMANVGDTISRIKSTFLDELSPAITEIAGKFSDLAASVDWEELASRVGDFVGSIDLDSIFDSIENALRNVDFDSLFDTIGDIIGGLISFAQAIAPVISTVAEFGAQLFGFFERMNPQVKLFLVGFLGAIVAVGKLGGAISSIGGAVSGVGKIASAFSTGAGDQFYNTFVKWSVIIIAIIGSLTLLIAMINTLLGKSGEMKSTLNSMGGAMNGMSGGASRPRAKAAASPARMAAAPTSEEGESGNGEEGVSLTASTFSRAATVRALESTIPNVERRVAIATAAMTPTAGTTPPPPVYYNMGGGDYRPTAQPQTPQVINISFTGDLAELGRILKPVIDAETRRIGPGV